MRGSGENLYGYAWVEIPKKHGSNRLDLRGVWGEENPSILCPRRAGRGVGREGAWVAGPPAAPRPLNASGVERREASVQIAGQTPARVVFRPASQTPVA